MAVVSSASMKDLVEEEINGKLDSPGKFSFLEKVRQSNVACQNGDFENAVQLYTDALALDSTNHILYSNRSAAFIKLGKHSRALQDAVKARELNPKWPKAYYRQGVALQCLGRHADALATFASGLSQDPKNVQLLAGLVESAMKSPLRATLEPTYRQLQTMHLDKSPFVIISVIGQELLAAGHHAAAIVVLESALKISTCSLKLRGSVFSALSSAYWALNSLDKAISYMQQDLAVARSLGDVIGECRAHGNLGAAYFSKGCHKAALTSHRYQLVLAMKCKDTHAAAAALTSLGHVYTATGDYLNALASHKQCVQLVKQMGDKLQEAREIGNVGVVYLAMGDFENAVECHLEHLRIAKQLGNKIEEARAYSNLGSSHHYRRNFDQAIMFHSHVLQLTQELGDQAIEARAYAGLGHAARCMGDYQQAKRWHEKQLDVALATRDKVAEGRACSNLGIVYQLLGNHDAALKLHQAHLNVARSLQDRAGLGRAFGNIGNAYSAMGYYKEAIKYHKQELTISKEVNDRSSEASTHGNLAVAYQALGMHEMALLHYHSHLNIARELKDTAGEACALCNLGNCHSSRGEFAQAIPYYESYLMLSQELHDVEGEAKACHFLGYAHYCLGNFREAIRYYNQDLALAKDLQDKVNMGHAYCNLGLAHLALNNYETALECQKYFLAIAHMVKNMNGKFRALGNIGDVLMKMNNTDEAIKVYQKQLALAKQSGDRTLEAGAFGALGLVHRVIQCYDKGLGYHTQELTLRQEVNDLKGECRAHSHLGAVHMALGNYTNAIKCYEEQLERAQDLKDSHLQAQACGNLGIAHLNMGHFEDAIGYFEQQLATLEQVPGNVALLDKGRGYGNLGNCYEALGDYEEAIKCHEQFLAITLKVKSLRDQERAYSGLGNSHRCLGNLQQTLVCFEKRLVVAHEMNNALAKAAAYGELGGIHSLLGNFEQAISCLEHQLNIAQELKDKSAEADAAHGLGNVYQQMREYEAALRYHQLDLTISEETGNSTTQARAYGNLGVSYESLGNFDQAVRYQELHLNIASQIGDKAAKISALSSLGRIHHALSNSSEAVSYLQRGLQIAEQISRREDEAKIRHRLGLALWGHGDLEGAQQQLYRATDLFEAIRRETNNSSDYRLSLFDLQTASYQALQRVLVSLGREDEALVIAERGRTRAFIDLLLERQTTEYKRGFRVDEASPTSLSSITDIVNRQKATVLYYSLAANYLYIWVIVPNRGIVKFHEHNLNEMELNQEQNPSDSTPTGISLLEQYIANVREALGVEVQSSASKATDVVENENDAADQWHHLEELGDKLNREKDRSGFLRMVNRNHLFNSSNYSLSSLFSLGSVTGSILSGSTSRPGSIRTQAPAWPGPSCVRALYDLLIAPIEDVLLQSSSRDLLLVLEGELYLVPFPVLKGSVNSEYLCENYTFVVAPSIHSLKANRKSSMRKQESEMTSALVVGNPRLPSTITDQWGWDNLPFAEQEANQVAEILCTSPLIGPQATKENVLRQLSQVECIHFATHISWKLSAIVLCPGDFVEAAASRKMLHVDGTPEHEEDAGSEIASTVDLPALSEFLLTAADILNLKLNARLVVVSSCHSRNKHGKIHSDGIVGLTRALLAAGAQCVLVSLWPIPDTAVKIMLRTFYSSLLQGSRVSQALSAAMHTVQNTKQFAHPANWAGFVLIGSDVRISSKVALMGQALGELLKVPDKCRDALRVVLHLVEKSLQRIHRGHKNAMYTTQKSIENKVGTVQGWKDLLISVGFRFEPAANGISASVFFPQSDPNDRLTQCSASLQALLGLSATSLSALSKLLSSPEVAEDIIVLMRQVIAQFPLKDLDCESVEVPVAVKLWRVPGCHELLASLGFDLREVGQEVVMLRTSRQANKRNIQFALQSLLALFDTQEAPNSLSLDESSSMESLVSSPSDSSNLQNTPPPPVTPPYIPLCSLSQLGNKSGAGAFTSYVRGRGEPDGHTAMSSEIKGRESDAAFTPSPIEPIAKLPNASHSPSGRSSPQPSSLLVLSLDHQSKIRSMYANSDGMSRDRLPSSLRCDSSSSTSSTNDWDNGQNTIRCQRRPTSYDMNIIRPEIPKVLDDEENVPSFDVPQPSFETQPSLLITNESQPNSSSADTNLYVKGKQRLYVKNINEDQTLQNKYKNKCMPSTQDWKTKIAPSSRESSCMRNRNENTLPLTNKLRKVTNFKIKMHGSLPDPFPSQSPISQTLQQDTDSTMYSMRPSEDAASSKGHSDKRNVQDHIAVQLNRLNRDMSITDVYHDRSLGLGLAPPLSTLLISTVNSLDAHNVDTLSVSSDKTFTSENTLQLDSNYNLQQGSLSSWSDIKPWHRNFFSSKETSKDLKFGPSNATTPSSSSSNGTTTTATTNNSNPNVSKSVSKENDSDNEQNSLLLYPPLVPPVPAMGIRYCHRDEGDGHSMTESLYSTCNSGSSLSCSTVNLQPSSKASDNVSESHKDSNDDQVITALEQLSTNSDAQEISTVKMNAAAFRNQMKIHSATSRVSEYVDQILESQQLRREFLSSAVSLNDDKGTSHKDIILINEKYDIKKQKHMTNKEQSQHD